MAITGKQMRAVIVGASSNLGKELAEELKGAPAAAGWDLRLFDESDEAEVQLAAAGDDAVLIQPLTQESLEGADLVFFAGEALKARELWRAASKAGTAVIDLTGALEGETGFLVRSPWIQGGAKPDLMTVGLVSAHPAALMLALMADRLQHRLGLKTLTATVLEPASQAGKEGLDELHKQTVSLLSFQSVPQEIFDAQVAFNLQSALGEASRVQLGSVSEVIRRHVGLLLGAQAKTDLRLQVVQAPVFHGYTISAMADLAVATHEQEIRRALHGGVVVADGDTAPSNLAATESGDLLVDARAEAGKASGTAYWLWMAADNLRLAARNALAAALELAALRPTANVQ
ncbi:MAG: Asd/ArgC dimerization domain-containing protein [Janthinobacterium lividum]